MIDAASMGTGEITRYIARYGTRRLRRVALIGTIGPFLLKTPNNPEGVDPTVFAGLKAAIKADRPAAIRNIIEAANNYDVLGGTLVSQRVIEDSWNVGASASPIAAVKSIDAWIEDFREDIPHNDLPTLILHAGEQDRVLPPAATSRRQAKLLKNCKLIELSDAPHNILWTHADRVNQELVKFLQ
jgi:non-heme chloroperoxidase